MGRHKKFKKEDVSKIQKWLKEDFEERKVKGRIIWNHQTDIICKWGLYSEGEDKGPSIKRFIKRKDGKTTWHRLKKKFYKDFYQSQKELENIVIYLNGLDPAEHRAGIKYRLKEGYIPRVHVINFCREVKNNFLNDDKKDIENRINGFINYGLNWFQNKTHKVNEWKKYDKKWGQCLLNYNEDIKDSDRIFPLGELRSKNTIIRVIWLMNKFMEYLHQQYPNKYPPTYFDPITNSQFRSLEMIRKQRGLVRDRKHIKSEHWEIIKRNIENDPHLKIIEICYEFGLRRSEALALSSVENLFKDNLFVKEQVKCIDYTNGVMTRIFKPTKTGETRRIPYKASISEISIKRIATIIDTFEFISPNQLTKKWRVLMNELNLDYDIHDCRHSFCRNLFKIKNLDIKTAMEYSGHKELQSINGYLRSKSEFSEEKLNLRDFRVVA
ncbi:MAG: tyrosine-type recombinase/integrase [Bdellovibrionales bacterium]|nr:tyrosine-type recombinase/integrase [Bdellovibrionales bacterium]